MFPDASGIRAQMQRHSACIHTPKLGALPAGMICEGLSMMDEVVRLRQVVERSYRRIDELEDDVIGKARRERQFVEELGHVYVPRLQIGNQDDFLVLEERLRRQDDLLGGLVPGSFTNEYAWLDSWDVPAVTDFRIPTLDYREGFRPVRPCRDYRRSAVGAEVDELNSPSGTVPRRLVSAGQGFAVLLEDYRALIMTVSDLSKGFDRHLSSQELTNLATKVARVGIAAFFPGRTGSLGTFELRDGFEFQWKRLEAFKGKFH
jgi:hypothetical protein